jgi:Flp pilus assembly protein TadD
VTETAAGAALRYARAAWQRGDASAAESHSRRALELDPGDGRAWAMLGVALRQRDPAEAEAALRRAAVRLRLARNRRSRGQERPPA